MSTISPEHLARLLAGSDTPYVREPIRRVARYTDGTDVREGDHIRFHQTPGGILDPGNWRYGQARRLAGNLDPDELFLLDPTTGLHYQIVGHVIERTSPAS